MEKNKIRDKLIELNESIKDSLEFTSKQIDFIKSENILSIIISLIASIGIVYLLKIASYWIIASFIIIYLWGLRGLISAVNFSVPRIKNNSIGLSNISKRQIILLVDWIITSITVFCKSTSIVYGITVFLIFGINTKLIEYNGILPVLIPIVTLSIHISLPLILDFFRKYVIKELNSDPELDDSLKTLFINMDNPILTIIILISMILLILFDLISPALSLLVMKIPIDSWLLLILVVILQFITILLISSYYNKLFVIKFLSNVITCYSDINNQIRMFLLKESYDEKIFYLLQNSYLSAKSYDVLIDDSNLFIQQPFFIINRTCFISLGDVVDENKDESKDKNIISKV